MLAFYLSMLETPEDRQKFTRLYEAWETKLYAVALHILANPSQAEDAVQQTWLYLLSHWERVSAFAWEEIGGYAVTAVKNAAMDLLRKERRTVPFPDTWEAPAREEATEEYAFLVSLIQSLPEGYRRILELKCVEEETNREIARRMGLNESTVATRIKRGRAILRERLEQEGFHGGAV